MNKHYDIGVIGFWCGSNYGSLLNGYATYKIIKSFGYSPLMVSKINASANDKEMNNTHNAQFVKKFYDNDNISPNYSYERLRELNQLCDGFCTGSDQTWNYGLSSRMATFLNFADDEKRKISFASSFGHAKDFTPQDKKGEIRRLLGRYDAISVREQSGIKICESYGIKAEEVLEPVFCIDENYYFKLAEQSTFKESGKYMLTYILDPTPEKRKAILFYGEKLGLKIINILDGVPHVFEQNKTNLDLPNTLENVQAEDFLKAYINAEFVITDSFHGTAFAIIFNKPFISITNFRRGAVRFGELLGKFDLMYRLIPDPNNIPKDEKYLNSIDFFHANEVKISERKRTVNWLKNALETPKEKLPSVINPNFNYSKIEAEIERANADPQLIKVKILVALLRDYGIRNVVLSPGGRDVPIVKMFEFNDEYFNLYHVTDERSAGYFALGLASKIHASVAMVCTSGTAASNYLPAITEAFYTRVPIIAITADRYPMFVNQGEDQTIPQVGMYDKVIKKSCSISIGTGPLSEWETRRNISDCILECTRDIPGPVHINVPIHSLWTPKQMEAYELPKKLKHILRVTRSDSEKRWDDWVRELKKSKRILIVYGQNYPVTSKQKEDIERFAEKYNCIIITDHLSNLRCSYSIHPYTMLKKITQEEFNKLLSPDILITVGGKRVMNDPLTDKVRKSSESIRHWSVTPNGEIKDFYYRLTSVLECTQDWFFKYFANKAGDIKNDNIYYSEWTSLLKKTPPVIINKYSSRYVLSKFLPIIPPKSFIHLGVGLTFIDSQNYSIGEEVEVFCNMGTNGIDGCTSSFMGQCELASDEELCFLAVGDLSFFYDMNGVWNKNLKKNIRILMMNNSGTDLLRGNNSPAITAAHCTVAEGWVKSLGFTYFSATSKEEFDNILPLFVSREINEPVFFEVFT